MLWDHFVKSDTAPRIFLIWKLQRNKGLCLKLLYGDGFVLESLNDTDSLAKKKKRCFPPYGWEFDKVLRLFLNETEPHDIEENTCYDPSDNGPQPVANGDPHAWSAQSITWEEERTGAQKQDSLTRSSCGDRNRLLLFSGFQPFFFKLSPKQASSKTIDTV